MGIVWEAYHKRVPLLGVPGITLDPSLWGNIGEPEKQILRERPMPCASGAELPP